MGLYIHHGRDGKVAVLEDLLTCCRVPGYRSGWLCGRRNELWYVRLLPPPIPGSLEHVVFTTPYVVMHPDYPTGWRTSAARSRHGRAWTTTSAT